MPSLLRDKTFWLLAIFVSVYVLCNIGTGSLSTWDEAVYANVSGNIVRTGDLITMQPRIDKPPLYMWCTALFYNIFGINEFSVRLTSALFGIATILLVYLFAKKISDSKAGVLAALLLTAAPHYLHFAKLGMLDVTLTFFITLMVYLFWIGQDKASCLLWSGIMLFFAYFTKGFAAISGPVIIFIYCLFSGNLKILFKREFILGMAISILAIFLWHFMQYISTGAEAVKDYFVFYIFRRATTALDGHTGGVNFYQKVIFNKNKPWSVLFYGSAIYMLWLSIKSKDRRAILMISWIAALYVICTAVQTKLHWYIIPVYPALAIASAVLLERCFRKRAFYFVLSIILMGMLIQVPVSWAFKLSYNEKAKDAAKHSQKLPYIDDGTTFYYETVNIKGSQ